MEIPCHISWTLFLWKLKHFTCKISHVAKHVYVYRNEVIIEWYCIFIAILEINKNLKFKKGVE